MENIVFVLLALFFSYMIYLLLDTKENDLIKDRLEKMSQIKKHSEEEEFDIKREILKLLKPYFLKSIKKNKSVKEIKQLLFEAGKTASDDEVALFMAQKTSFGLAGLGAGALVLLTGKFQFPLNIGMLLILALALYRMPDIMLKKEAKYRVDEITYNLPDALDLLTVCVEAGLGLDAAMLKVSDEQMRTCPILAKEFRRVNSDVANGISRHDALRNLANRNNVPDLKSFATLLIQAEKLGTSVGNSLRVYADSYRTKRRQRAEELAAKASVKMVIPLALFVLPSMFVVLLTPAMIKLMENFAGMKGAGG